MIRMQIVLAFSAGALPTVSADSERRPSLERPASSMTSREIAAYNVGLKSTHPDYIKCRKIEILGSLVKKARVCHTNEKWSELWEQGNRNARDTVDHFGSKGGGCPPGALC